MTSVRVKYYIALHCLLNKFFVHPLALRKITLSSLINLNIYFHFNRLYWGHISVKCKKVKKNTLGKICWAIIELCVTWFFPKIKLIKWLIELLPYLCVFWHLYAYFALYSDADNRWHFYPFSNPSFHTSNYHQALLKPSKNRTFRANFPATLKAVQVCFS